MAIVKISELPVAAAGPDTDDVVMFEEDDEANKKVVADIFNFAAEPVKLASVTSAAFAANAIDSAEIADNAVTTASLSPTAANATTLAHTAVTPGAFTTSITVDAQGRVTGGVG